ncbi:MULTISPECIES: DUF1338 domain-containing protein [Vreelandella]|uniref:2-oxoadipate dioxygenase/decarboxylase n=2 Tax=Vreelandella TaxID=3137766 RepID=A0A7C9NNR8_9GAMM|nr:MULTISPECIES: DUF1338 domain-containing protein [Halomonas]NDL69448.1 DUF1338 domain-containing protein [Halomonas alkaliphila]NYS43843.1 DUF1338 domain-containing protein [Halomonas zhaodongensis]
MQREEFVQQLWLDYIHTHPDIGGLRLWPMDTSAEYLTLVTLNYGPFSASTLSVNLAHMGYRLTGQYAMADKGILIHLLAPSDGSSWLVLAELQLGTLPKLPREALTHLVLQSHPEDCKGHNLLCRGRPWPMPSWTLYTQLQQEHPLAAWLSVMGPRLHHAGFNCLAIGETLDTLHSQLEACGLPSFEGQQNGVFTVSSLLEHRFYPAMPQKIVFGEGDEHRLCLGGLALVQKHIADDHERIAEVLLPSHTRCEMA